MKLKNWLEKRRKTAASFSREIDVAHTTIGRYLTGERFPRPAILIKIEKATDGEVTAGDFLLPSNDN